MRMSQMDRSDRATDRRDARQKAEARRVLVDQRQACGTCGSKSHATAGCPYRFGGGNYNHVSNPDGV